MPNMAATFTAIYRYPVKGLSAEKLDRVALAPGECLPHDRRFAIALGSTPFDPQRPEWLSKIHFIMLMRDEKLAQLQTSFDAESDVLEIAENGQVLLRARMTEPEGCRLIAEFFEEFPIIAIQEAGLDGFWIHRALEQEGIESHIVDAASIMTSRRRRRAKTDRIDGEALLRALMAYKRGEPRVCAMVRVPTPEDEDRRRISRAAPGHAFADARRKPNATTDKYISLINRASIAALEHAMDEPVDPIRFRANVYFEGAAAWSEHDWIDTEIILGHARLRVISPITRCAATRSIPSPLSEISTSSQPSVERSAISIWGSTPRWWRVARSRSAMRCLGCPGRNEAIGCLAGSTFITVAGPTCRAMRSCPQPARTSVGR